TPTTPTTSCPAKRRGARRARGRRLGLPFDEAVRATLPQDFLENFCGGAGGKPGPCPQGGGADAPKSGRPRTPPGAPDPLRDAVTKHLADAGAQIHDLGKLKDEALAHPVGQKIVGALQAPKRELPVAAYNALMAPVELHIFNNFINGHHPGATLLGGVAAK